MAKAASSYPRASLSRVVADLGDTLLEVVAGEFGHASQLGGVVIYDPADEFVLPAQAIVLGVGAHSPEEICALLTAMGSQDGAALIARMPVDLTPEVQLAVKRSGVSLLGLVSGASWSQLAAMLRTILLETDLGERTPSTLGGMPSGDLFAVANAIAALLDAPITIEDRNFNVLAFSGRQDEADQSRIETVLGRQVPQRFATALEGSGAIADLYRSSHEVYVEPHQTEYDEIAMLRVAVAVRAGDEILGSIWAAVDEPLDEERTRTFIDSAKFVALHMLRLRAGDDVERRLRADMVATALEGGAASQEALGRLGLLGKTIVVAALGVLDEDSGSSDSESEPRSQAELQRIADAFAVHLSAVAPRSAVALLGQVVYGLFPITGAVDGGEVRARAMVSNFLSRTGTRAPIVVGLGVAAGDVIRLGQSRVGADRALRVLRLRSEAGQVASGSEIQVEALLLELRDQMLAKGDELVGPLARLKEYDASHGSRLVETLEAWLDAFGDAPAAAAEAEVHVNTFRYRLRRVAEVGEVDLTDSDGLFAAMLELRLARLGQS